MDPRVKKLAKILVEHSTKVRKGDKVVIVGDVIAEPLIKEVYKLCLKKGAYPAVHAHLPGMAPIFYKKDVFNKIRHGVFWLSDSPFVSGSKSWGSVFPRTVTWVKLDLWGDRRILFVNTHFKLYLK